jgi:hypothetical protein
MSLRLEEENGGALCATYSYEDADRLWFAEPGSLEASEAKRICMACPLYFPCQTYALEEGVTDGVWGGMDKDDRYRIWYRGKGMPTTFMDDIQRAFNGMTRDGPRAARAHPMTGGS